MAPTYEAPRFQFEENRLVHALRTLAYPGFDFTSADCVRCAFAVAAARHGNRAAPAHEPDAAEWQRVLDLIQNAEPKAWVEKTWEESVETRQREAEETSRRSNEH
jgi:hypothetical protein